MTGHRSTFLVEKLTTAVRSADALRARDSITGRKLSPDTRNAREYALAVKGRLLGHVNAGLPPEPYYARPAWTDFSHGARPHGDWDSAMVAYMRELGIAGFMNRAMRRSLFPSVQRIDGVW